MKTIDLTNVKDVTDGRLVPGGYICKIIKIEDVPDKEYLRIEYDIADGEFKDYFFRLFESRGFWAGRFIKSYKESALSFFKRFITSIENSNNGFKFNGSDEQSLKGKYIGLVLGEEEYRSNTGEIKTRIYVDMERSLTSIREGDYKTPDKKSMNSDSPATAQPVPEITDNDLPF